MATSNFHNVNASRIFAKNFDESYYYDFFIEELTDTLNELRLADLVKNSKGLSIYFKEGDGTDKHELRSFPSRVLGTLSIEKAYKDFNLEVEIISVVRSGYYSGCNLDYDIKVLLDGEEIEDNDFKDHLVYAYDYSNSKAIKYQQLLTKSAATLKDIIVQALELIYHNQTTPLQVVAQFSNGETIYRTENQSNEEAISAYLK